MAHACLTAGREIHVDARADFVLSLWEGPDGPWGIQRPNVGSVVNQVRNLLALRRVVAQWDRQCLPVMWPGVHGLEHCLSGTANVFAACSV